MKGARESERAKKKETRKARKRYLAALALDRRFIVELDDLMERMWKIRHSIGSEQWPLDQMLEALERHCEKVRRRVYWRRGIPDRKLLPKPEAPQTNDFF
jgi:hypothetical protein